MKITIFTAGSQGDIQPCITLAKGMQQSGYEPILAAPADFMEFIQKYKVDFFPLRGDVKSLMASDTGREFMQKGGSNPIRAVLSMRKLIAPVVMNMMEDTYEACKKADALICLGVFSAFGKTIADALGIPMINIEPTPLLPTRSFPAPSWPIQKNLGGVHNYLSGKAMLMSIWLWYFPFIDQIRKKYHLPPVKGNYLYHSLKSTPLIGAYSPSIIPHPSDWPDSVHVTGFLFLDSSQVWQPSPELLAFLDAGKPPVSIGFGSMAGQYPEKMASLVVRALEKSGQRGILLTGWGGLKPGLLSKNVFTLQSAPYQWLFPRMAALVHHGGAGTTAQALRAGVPSVVVPYILDQQFWGARLASMGLAPDPLPQRRLTADRLADAISMVIGSPEMHERAGFIGKKVRAEMGMENAVKVVRQYLGLLH